jgi:hypothetical protein
MTKTENTAVNRLIEQAHSAPVDADDALFSSPPSRKHSLPRPFPNRIGPVDPPAPMPRNRIPNSTQTELKAAPPAAKKTIRPDDLKDSGLLQVDDDEDDDLPMTIGEPAVRVADIQPIAARPSALGHIPGIDENNWYEESVGVDRVDEAQLGTRFVRRPSRAKSFLLLGAAFAAGLAATAYIAWPSKSPSIAPVASKAPAVAPRTATAPVVAPTTTTVAVVEPAAAAEPAVVPPVVEPAVAEPAIAEPAVVEPAVVEPVVVEPAVPALLAVELDSEPSGATVLLVDGSTTVTLGATPFTHELEPTRSYELMFTLSGHRSALITVDPTKSQRVSVDLASSTATAAPRAEAAVAVETKVAKAEPKRVAKAEPKPAPKAASKAQAKAAPRVAIAPPAKPVAKVAGGKGMLMIGAKPPCDIFIDGKPTRLKTPQREIKLAPGPHKITLVNKEHKITETFTVDVKAGAPTKVVKDLTKRMR